MHSHLPWCGPFLLVTLATAQSNHATTPPDERQSTMGRVVDVLGEPIPAALVEVIVDGRIAQVAHTDGEGIYLIPKMPRDVTHLQISADGKASTLLPWRGVLTPAVQNATLRDASKVYGKVTDSEGNPIPEVDVIAVFGRDSKRTRTDIRGEYVLDAVPVGPINLNLWDDRCGAQTWLQVQQDCQCNLQVPASNGTRVRVRVKGLPENLDEARVEVTTSNIALMQDGGRVPLTPDGSATVLIHETAIVMPRIDGFVIQPTSQLATRTSTNLEFEARPAAPNAHMKEISGQVLAVNRVPVRQEPLFFFDRRMRPMGTARIDRHGNFRGMVQRSSDDHYRVGIALDNWVLLDDEGTLRHGFSWQIVSGHKPIELLTRATGTIAGRVRDKTGASMALARVTIATDDAPHRTLAECALDQTGKLRIALPQGHYHLLAVSHQGSVCTGEVRVHAGKHHDALLWDTIPTGSVSGRLVDSEQKPMPGAELLFASRDIVDPAEVRATSRQKVRVITNREGKFQCRGLPEGEWTVIATNHPDVEMTLLKIQPNKKIEIQLAQGQ